MTFQRVRPNWSHLAVPDDSDFEQFDGQLFRAIDSLGGSYTSTTEILVAGEGIADLAFETITIAGGIEAEKTVTVTKHRARINESSFLATQYLNINVPDAPDGSSRVIYITAVRESCAVRIRNLAGTTTYQTFRVRDTISGRVRVDLERVSGSWVIAFVTSERKHDSVVHLTSQPASGYDVEHARVLFDADLDYGNTGFVINVPSTASMGDRRVLWFRKVTNTILRIVPKDPVTGVSAPAADWLNVSLQATMVHGLRLEVTKGNKWILTEKSRPTEPKGALVVNGDTATVNPFRYDTVYVSQQHNFMNFTFLDAEYEGQEIVVFFEFIEGIVTGDGLAIGLPEVRLFDQLGSSFHTQLGFANENRFPRGELNRTGGAQVSLRIKWIRGQWRYIGWSF